MIGLAAVFHLMSIHSKSGLPCWVAVAENIPHDQHAENHK